MRGFSALLRMKISNAQHLPALNLHLTKSRLNDAPRLCEMLNGNPNRLQHREGKKVELSWALVDEYE
jgi:hypothetical protein